MHSEKLTLQTEAEKAKQAIVEMTAAVTRNACMCLGSAAEADVQMPMATIKVIGELTQLISALGKAQDFAQHAASCLTARQMMSA